MKRHYLHITAGYNPSAPHAVGAKPITLEEAAELYSPHLHDSPGSYLKNPGLAKETLESCESGATYYLDDSWDNIIVVIDLPA